MTDYFGAFGSLKAARNYAAKEADRLSKLLFKDNPVLFIHTAGE
jgi:hypothetical protein